MKPFPSKGYSIKNQANNHMEFFLFDEIGADNYWDADAITPARIAKDLKEAGPSLQSIDVFINSPGGSVFAATAIHSLFKNHQAYVRVEILGLAASAASIVAMAGNLIEIDNLAMIMIHRPYTFSAGNADDLRHDASLLDQVESVILRAYMGQIGKRGAKTTEGQLAAMLSAETWLGAQQAYDVGLVDKVSEGFQAAACFDLRKFQYKNVPPAALRQRDDSAIQSKLIDMRIRSMRARAGG